MVLVKVVEAHSKDLWDVVITELPVGSSHAKTVRTPRLVSVEPHSLPAVLSGVSKVERERERDETPGLTGPPHHHPAPSGSVRPSGRHITVNTFTRWSDTTTLHTTGHHWDWGQFDSFLLTLIWFSPLNPVHCAVQGSYGVVRCLFISILGSREDDNYNWSCSINFSESPRKGDWTNKPSSVFVSPEIYWTTSATMSQAEKYHSGNITCLSFTWGILRKFSTQS